MDSHGSGDVIGIKLPNLGGVSDVVGRLTS